MTLSVFLASMTALGLAAIVIMALTSRRDSDSSQRQRSPIRADRHKDRR